MSHSLNSLNWVLLGGILGTTIGAIKGDTRSLDNGTYGSELNKQMRPCLFGRAHGAHGALNSLV